MMIPSLFFRFNFQIFLELSLVVLINVGLLSWRICGQILVLFRVMLDSLELVTASFHRTLLYAATFCTILLYFKR